MLVMSAFQTTIAAQMPFLAKYAEFKHMTPDQLRSWVNSLTPDQVHEILMLLKDGVSNNEIAVRFGVSSLTITHIKKGRTWKVLVERFNRAGEDTVR